MKSMKDILVLLFCIMLGVNSAFAYELVLPKEKKSIVDNNYAFFVGKANNNETITLNDEKVYIASNGAFAHTIKLKEGENRIVLRSNYKTQVYKFYKNKKEQQYSPELIEFESQLYKIKEDNTPLRSTPENFGMNRLSHLFKGTNLIINGEKNGFFRVFLSKDKTAWVDKEKVCKSESLEISPKFLGMNSKTFKNASVHTIEFTEKLPYTIEETNKEIIFKVYNPLVSDNSVYTVNIEKPEKYTYKTNSSFGNYQFKVNKLPVPEIQTLEGLTIVVDAGHGGSEKGAIGCLGDNEKDINLSIAQELKDILCQMGATVIMTRECDGTISLDERVKLAQDNNSNIFISIHLNSIPDTCFSLHKHNGTSVYYYNKNSKQLAESVQESVVKGIGTRKEGVKTASFAVLRPTDYIGILVEVAYMTNPNDSVLYRTETFPRESAKAIADGIFNFINCSN